MMTVLVTGADGFIGRNLLARLELREDIKVLPIDLGNSRTELSDGLGRADFVFHLAGVNRPKETGEFESGNKGFTEDILEILEARKSRVPLLLSSSIQAALDNPYGSSKRGAEEAVQTYRMRSDSAVFLFRLPNVFGKWCRPNYNSVVATWCHNTARGLPIQVNDPATELHLVHVDDVAEAFIQAMDGSLHPSDDGYCHVAVSYRRSLGQIAWTLDNFAQSRSTLVMPDLSDSFDLKLYGTWVSYLPEDGFSYALDMKRDDRGWLAEFIKSKTFGQVFVSRTKAGITRGNHWHHTKVEKFLVLSGTALVRFRRIGSSEVLEYPMSGDELRVIDIPTGYTHSITNVGEQDLLTLFWADEIFDPAAPDTYFLGV